MCIVVNGRKAVRGVAEPSAKVGRFVASTSTLVQSGVILWVVYMELRRRDTDDGSYITE
jgi:hypothetical protein